MIWLSLLIPLLFAIGLWLGFQRKVNPLELIIPMLVSILLIFGANWFTEWVQTNDTEYWTGWGVKAEYFEHWNELVSRIETYTDAQGNLQTRTVWEIEDHPPEWWLWDNNSLRVSLSSKQFEELAQRWNSRKKVKLHHGFTIWGDKYESFWPEDDATMEVVCTTHGYRNRVQASDSIFKFRKVDKAEKKQYGLFDYPKVKGHSQSVILGITDEVAERKFSLLNARLGKSKQVRIWVLIFQDQPLEAAIAQMNYWGGGNKNELVICIGTEKVVNATNLAIRWEYIFSWCERETFKAEVRNLIAGRALLNLGRLADELQPLIENGWERKQFHDFDYLSIHPPWWTIPLIYLIVLALNIGLALFFMSQDR